MLFNLILAGVGGQGSILLSQMVGTACIEEGYFTSIGESFGVSQRGGDVISQIRISDDSMKSPWMLSHNADLIVGLEPIETLRAAGRFMNPNTDVLINPRPLHPTSVTSGEATYPDLEDILEGLRGNCRNLYIIESTKLALDELNNSMASNMVMAGAIAGSGFIPVSLDSFEKALDYTIPERIYDLNLKAFNLGNDAIKEMM